MSEYVITFDDEDWFFEYAHEKYTHFFGCPIEEIVRCKDCKYSDKGYWCRYFGKYGDLVTVTPDGFCSWAERREQ